MTPRAHAGSLTSAQRSPVRDIAAAQHEAGQGDARDVRGHDRKRREP